MDKKAHVETVCQLSNHRRRLDSYVKLEVDAGDYYRIKDGESEPLNADLYFLTES